MWNHISAIGFVVMIALSPAAGRAQEPRPDLEPHSLLAPVAQEPGRGETTNPRRMPPELTTVPSDVRDTAGLFSESAVRSAREALERIEKSIGAPVLIESIDSLEGKNPADVATRLASRAGTQGVFVLIARKESKIEVRPSRRYEAALPRAATDPILRAFIDRFRRKQFDDGLRDGIAALETALSSARAAGKLPSAEQPAPEEATNGRRLLSSRGDSKLLPGPDGNRKPRSPLVRRDRIHLTLEGARVIIAAASRQAAEMKLKVNIAVVDDGGHLLSFDRMDEARPASGYTAITKATAAATFRQPTGPIPAGTTSPDLLLNVSLQLAAQAGGGKITTLFGGVPVVVDDQVIGGVGVGGGTGEQDATVARAGIQAILEALKSPAPPERK